MPKAKYILVLEYEGTRYHGFQWQAGLATIQNELEEAIRKFCGDSSRVMSASRTDAGVHARGQVVTFWARPSLSPASLVKALNYYLPGDIAVKAAHRAADDFNVRRDALSREYRYYILNSSTRSSLSRRLALFVPQALSVEAMNQACLLMQGQHDFASFATSLDEAGNTVRNIHEAKVEKGGDFLIFRVVANSFLRHQIRNTAGLLMRLGLGRISLNEFRDIMEARKSGSAGPTAPALGLCLSQVKYAKPLGEASGIREVEDEHI